MSNEIAKVNYQDAEVLAVIKNTICQGATNEEFNFFVQLCKSTGLNPLKKEVWFIKTKSYTKKDGTRVDGKVQTMTGINGFYEIANKNPNYDGVSRVYGQEVEVSAGARKIKVPEWVETSAYRKDRNRPQIERAYWSEFAGDLVSFGGNLTVWGQKPRVMLEKCSDALALRKAFPQELNGLYIEEEFAQVEQDRIETQAFDDIERKQRENYKKQQQKKLEDQQPYIIELGSSLRGQCVAEIDNGIALAKHLEKYRPELPELAIKQIESRLRELRKEFKEMKERERLSKLAEAVPEAQDFDATEIPTFEEMQARELKGAE